MALPIDPQITVGKFANGLRYIIRVNKKPEARAELRLVVDAKAQRGQAFAEQAAEHRADDVGRARLLPLGEVAEVGGLGRDDVDHAAADHVGLGVRERRAVAAVNASAQVRYSMLDGIYNRIVLKHAA